MTPDLLLNPHCQLGENPLWDEREGALYWTDITGGKIHRYAYASREHRVIYEGEQVGGFTFQEDGTLLLFRVRDVASLDPKDGAVTVVLEVNDDTLARFNDVIADPAGRVFAGTMAAKEMSGGLYLLDHDGSLNKLWDGTKVSNGMGFSPDLSRFYWTDSTAKHIYAYDYEQRESTLSNRTLLYQAEDEGTPDGMTVDADGNLWSARWDGHAVVKHAPDGKVLERITLPPAKVSAVCFAGPDLTDLVATSAGGGKDDSKEEDGALYRLTGLAAGRAEFRSSILL